MVRIKICGLKCMEDIGYVNQYLPDYIGFVFAKSSRRVSEREAAELKGLLDRQIKAVGVFVNEEAERIERLCRDNVIDVIQLHGDEGEAYIREIKERTGCPVIKAVRVISREQILEAQNLPCDYLLLDTYTKGQYGGSGKCFDRTLIPTLQKPYFLAGGLTEENVESSIDGCCPFAVDVSGGVELDGYKDEWKIKSFIERVRRHE